MFSDLDKGTSLADLLGYNKLRNKLKDVLDKPPAWLGYIWIFIQVIFWIVIYVIVLAIVIKLLCIFVPLLVSLFLWIVEFGDSDSDSSTFKRFECVLRRGRIFGVRISGTSGSAFVQVGFLLNSISIDLCPCCRTA